MLRRGFKSWSEETSLRMRRALDVAASAPLDMTRVAALLKTPVLAPGDMKELPEDVRLRLLSEHREAWSAITVTDGRCSLIVVNGAHSPARQNSSLAHEIAHLLLKHEPSMMYMAPASGVALRTHNKDQEEEANWLSACLLLPRVALLDIRKRRLSDEQACSEFSVSPVMLHFRLNTSGVDVQISRGGEGRRNGTNRAR